MSSLHTQDQLKCLQSQTLTSIGFSCGTMSCQLQTVLILWISTLDFLKFYSKNLYCQKSTVKGKKGVILSQSPELCLSGITLYASATPWTWSRTSRWSMSTTSWGCWSLSISADKRTGRTGRVKKFSWEIRIPFTHCWTLKRLVRNLAYNWVPWRKLFSKQK